MNRSAREVPGVADELVGCEALRLWRCGAPTENLAHSVSFQSDERTAPTQPVTKHLVPKADDCPGGALDRSHSRRIDLGSVGCAAASDHPASGERDRLAVEEIAFRAHRLETAAFARRKKRLRGPPAKNTPV